MSRRWLSKLASGSTCHARCIRGIEHGDARLATASLSDQHADALQKTGGYRVGGGSFAHPLFTFNFLVCECSSFHWMMNA